MITNHAVESVDPRDAIDENATGLTLAAVRGGWRESYRGLRPDEHGYARNQDGTWTHYECYDGGGQ